MHSVGVIGAGAWGTALAVAVARAGRQVTLWGRNYADLVEMASRGENRNYLPGIRLNPVPRVTGDLIDVIQNDTVLLVLPAQEIRSLAPLIALSVRPLQPLVICAKGIERGSGRLMTELLKEFIPQARLAVLSGPTFATEVARGLPTAVTIAAADPLLASQLATSFSSRSFRCYASDDLLGVELGGALKNVLAIACGVVSGKGFGDNARAALMTRGLAELRRLGQALGAKPETFMGLSGSDKTGRFVQVGVEPVAALKTPVTLLQIKADPQLAKMALVTQSRLSVQPVTPAEWQHICKLGGVRG